MILTVLGAISILAGIGMVVYQAGQNWTRPGERLRKAAPGETRPAVSYWVVLLVGLGAILIAIGTSGAPPPPPN